MWLRFFSLFLGNVSSPTVPLGRCEDAETGSNESTSSAGQQGRYYTHVVVGAGVTATIRYLVISFVAALTNTNYEGCEGTENASSFFKILKAVVLLVLLYGCGTSALNSDLKRTTDVFGNT